MSEDVGGDGELGEVDRDALREDIEEQIRQAEEEGRVVLGAHNLDGQRECNWCGREMPVYDYNEHTPTTDYVIWIVPSEDDFEEAGKFYYCTASHLIYDQWGTDDVRIVHPNEIESEDEGVRKVDVSALKEELRDVTSKRRVRNMREEVKRVIDAIQAGEFDE